MYPSNQFMVSERIFAPRLSLGPLNHWERLYREFLSCEFWELLDIDPWLKTASPSARGQRVLVPLMRQLLGYRDRLPADMLEWVRLYQQLSNSALAYFDAWAGTDTSQNASRPGQHLRLVGA